jgi:3-methyladenine DNA glycosylase/8-oxoguanine DNA glycosylase
MTSNQYQYTLKNLAEIDPVMSKLINKIGPINLQPRRIPPFHSIIHAIIHQQLNGKVAQVIFDRFVSLFGNGDFPTPKKIQSIDFEIMRGAGLSRSKARYIKEVAELALMGIVPSLKECDNLNDTEIKDRLTKIKGVGPWTVEMLLIFNFGRPDVLPVHDLGVRKGFQIAYKKQKLPTPEQLERFGRKWRPYRTMATLYLWGAVDFINLNEW